MKIVLTGGPAAGKTTITEVLARTYPQQLIMVPESASILFVGGFPRAASDEEMRRQQLAIFNLQKEVENIVALKYLKMNLVCDRGSLDGLAYWPGDAGSFFSTVGSSLAAELARYDWVLHLDTTGRCTYQSTKTRIESHSEAEDTNAKVKEAWGAHPHHIVIRNSSDFDKKISVAVAIVGLILKTSNISQIKTAMKENIA